MAMRTSPTCGWTSSRTGNPHESPLGKGDEGRTSGGEFVPGLGGRDCLKCLEQRILFGARPHGCHDVERRAI